MEPTREPARLKPLRKAWISNENQGHNGGARGGKRRMVQESRRTPERRPASGRVIRQAFCDAACSAIRLGRVRDSLFVETTAKYENAKPQTAICVIRFALGVLRNAECVKAKAGSGGGFETSREAERFFWILPLLTTPN